MKLGRAPANGELLIGNGEYYTLAGITGGTGITVTPGAGTITITYSGAAGTVTSVGVSGGTTGLSFSNSPITTSGTMTMSGTLAVANGGTGQTTYTDGQLLIGNTTGNTLAKATLTAGTGVTITNGSGTITIASTGAWTLIKRTADQTVSSSTTFVDDNTLQFPVTAGSKYSFRGAMVVNATGTGGFKVAVNGPALSTGELRVATSSAAQTAYDTTFVTNGGGIGNYVFPVWGYFDCATTGTLTLRVAQFSASGSTVFETGSWIEYITI